jgi:ATP phosphoribosyltransferase regulatory subunit
MPARLFYVQNVFRFSPSGDDSEDWQCGVEYLDAPPVIGDVEVAAIACETLDALGLAPSVRLSHVGITRSIVDAIAPDQCVARDLLEQAGEQGLAAVRPAVNGHPQIGAFIEVALQPSEALPLLDNLRAIAAGCLPSAAPAIAELASIAGALRSAGRPVRVDLGMPRDFEYYTGVVFEFTSNGESWGGGGRYRPSGTNTPETACGLGLEAARLASHVFSSTRQPITVWIMPGSSSDLGRAVSVARALHRSGIAAALAEPRAVAAGIGVNVAGEQLVARLPDGEHSMSALDDLVGLLIQYK